MLPIIGLCGNAGAGKDTIANIIDKQTEGTRIIALAEPIKEFAKQVFGFNDEQLWGSSQNRNVPDPRFYSRESWDDAKDSFNFCRDIFLHTFIGYKYDVGAITDLKHQLFGNIENNPSPRDVLKAIGSWGRKWISSDIWLNQAMDKAREGFLDNVNLVIIPDVRYRNEILGIKAKGGKVIRIVSDGTQTDTHSSESEQNGVPLWWFDHCFVNFKTGLELLNSKTQHFMEFVLPVNWNGGWRDKDA